MYKSAREDLSTTPASIKAIGAIGSARVNVAGELASGLCFEGTQTIKIINREVAKAKAMAMAARLALLQTQ